MMPEKQDQDENTNLNMAIQPPVKKSHKVRNIAVVCLVALVAAGVAWWFIESRKPVAQQPPIQEPDDANYDTNDLTKLMASVSRTAPKLGWVDDGPLVTKNPEERPSMVRDYNGASNEYSFAIKEAGLRHTVLNVGVGELVSVENREPYRTTYKTNSIEDRIASVVRWNRENSAQKITVHLRFHVGKSVPRAWQDVCGTVHMEDPSFGVEADAPKWWAKSGDKYLYRDFYEKAMTVLGAQVSAINAKEETKNIIGSVNTPGAAPNYPEPMIIYTGSAAIRRNLIAGGFTADEHDKFMRWFPTMAKYFRGVTVELAMNPYQSILASGETDDSATTKAKYQKVANALIRTVGQRAVLANYSSREAYFDPARRDTSEYAPLYEWIERTKREKNVWSGTQMARAPRVVRTIPPSVTSDNTEKWDDVAGWTAARSYNFVETTGPKSNMVVSGIAQSGLMNRWPISYHDDSDDISTMKSIGDAFARNPHP